MISLIAQWRHCGAHTGIGQHHLIPTSPMLSPWLQPPLARTWYRKHRQTQGAVCSSPSTTQSQIDHRHNVPKNHRRTAYWHGVPTNGRLSGLVSARRAHTPPSIHVVPILAPYPGGFRHAVPISVPMNERPPIGMAYGSLPVGYETTACRHGVLNNHGPSLGGGRGGEGQSTYTPG